MDAVTSDANAPYTQDDEAVERNLRASGIL
jgi:hypothetical protein